MIVRRSCACATLLFAAAIGLRAQTPPVQPPAAPPDIAGKWTGTWSSFNPARATTPPQEQCKTVTADVVKKDAAWEATFEGDCGRPYKYTIKMEGRQVGRVVMFKGTVDLGPRDGGVFDWIGRATDAEFVGFFTSGFYTGVFNLGRVK